MLVVLAIFAVQWVCTTEKFRKRTGQNKTDNEKEKNKISKEMMMKWSVQIEKTDCLAKKKVLTGRMAGGGLLLLVDFVVVEALLTKRVNQPKRQSLGSSECECKCVFVGVSFVCLADDWHSLRFTSVVCRLLTGA